MTETLPTDAELLSILDTLPQPAPPPLRSVPAVVKELRQSDQDHEFYPTTDAIIRALVNDIGRKHVDENERRFRDRDTYSSVLDIGAGNGKVLLALRAQTYITDLHAIEKSSILCRDLDPDILVIGTDFHEQSLLSKTVDVIFCNPPYSEYEAWSEKIIRQAASRVVYLVIPRRWEQSTVIKDALKFRDATAIKVGEFDFEDAEDRKARAKVHLLKIRMRDSKEYPGHEHEDDAFERFFNEQFGGFINKFREAEAQDRAAAGVKEDEEPSKGGGDRRRPFHKLVPGPNYPEAMVNLYRDEMGNIEKNYRLVSELDVDLLREFEIFPAKIMACLKTRLSGLRNDYWHELFSKLSAITDRLTSKSRKKLLETLQKHVQVDFTVTNIYEIVVWVIKNANRYIDSQLIETYEIMVDKCNVVLYKSNKRVWVDERWRYNQEPEKNSHYALDYRIVTHRVGGVNYRYSKYELDERASEFLGDLMAIGRNMGFICKTAADPRLARWAHEETWRPGQPEEFYATVNKRREMLIEARGFKNGNLHLRLNKEFILTLNVEHGRLKGWINTAKEAAEELQDNAAAKYFKSNLLIGTDNPTLLLAERAA